MEIDWNVEEEKFKKHSVSSEFNAVIEKLGINLDKWYFGGFDNVSHNDFVTIFYHSNDVEDIGMTVEFSKQKNKWKLEEFQMTID